MAWPRLLAAGRRYPEAEAQQAVARWLDLRGVLFCASMAGLNLTARQAARMKANGYRRGAPDLMVYQPPPRCLGRVGYAIEMKSPGSRSRGTCEQQVWLKQLASFGWMVGVFHGADQAIYALEGAGY